MRMEEDARSGQVGRDCGIERVVQDTARPVEKFHKLLIFVPGLPRFPVVPGGLCFIAQAVYANDAVRE